MPSYVAHVVEGLQETVAADLAERLPRVRVTDTLGALDEPYGLLLFQHASAPADLPPLPLVDDLFLQIADVPAIQGGWSGLRAVRDAVVGARGFDEALALASTVRPAHSRKPTYRVVGHLTGGHAFLRSDLQHAIGEGMAERLPAWRAAGEDARFEIWAHLAGERLLLAVRLTDRAPRGGGLKASLPGTPRPSLARALVRLTQPEDDDIFLDPICGAGALLIARGDWGRYQQLLGGDGDEEAVAACLANIGPRYKPVEVKRWDPAALPLEDRSASRLATVIASGRAVGAAAGEGRALYVALLNEWRRVLRPDGRMALLTPEPRLLDAALQRQPALTIERRIPVQLRGRAAVIALLRPDEGARPRA